MQQLSKGKKIPAIERSPLLSEDLSHIVASDYRGPRASFSEMHVLKAIVAIGDAGSLGRTRLASVLELGQGEIRTLIKRLKDNDFILVKADGCELTQKGKLEMALISKTVPVRTVVEAGNLGIGKHTWAFLMRNRAKKIRLGIEQRDAAIRAGATGALTVVFTDGKFTIPVEGTDCEARGASEPWISLRKTHPREGDVVIISGASDPLTAEFGGWSAALTVL